MINLTVENHLDVAAEPLLEPAHGAVRLGGHAAIRGVDSETGAEQERVDSSVLALREAADTASEAGILGIRIREDKEVRGLIREGERKEVPLELRPSMEEMGKLAVGDTEYFDLRAPLIRSAASG